MRQILNVLRHIIDSKLNSKNSTFPSVLSSHVGGVIRDVSREAICRSRRCAHALVDVKGDFLSFT